MYQSARTKFIALLVGMLVLLGSPFGASANHRHVSKFFGTLTTVQVECDTLCTEGVLTGGLAGMLEFSMDSMTETNNPNVVRYVGVNTITTSEGTLTGTDHGIWNLVTGEFVDFTIFSEGTGKFAGAHGTLLIVGTFDPVSGTGSSNYFAVVR